MDLVSIRYWGRGVADGHLRRAEDAVDKPETVDALRSRRWKKRPPYAFLVEQMDGGPG